ncbi:MAG: hypothetical protein AMXMBFR13_06050 [Phycisphaerae bacterium]
MKYRHVCLIVIVLGLLLNALLLIRVSMQMAELREAKDKRSDLPCAAIPTRFVLDEPECADKLLRVMNVTNVRILPRGSSVPQMDDEMTE